jgi:peroxiredoxin
VTNLKDQPFALIGVHIGGSTAKQLKEVMEKDKITWRSFVDAGNAGAGPIATKWNVSATPTLYVIDHNGVIRYKWAGAPGEKVVDAALDKLIKAAERKGKHIPRQRY